MKRRFNTTGVCTPQKHYMVDISAKLERTIELIDDGLYFTINRARQFGKTTLMHSLWRTLSDRYLMIQISFETSDERMYDSPENFCQRFCHKISRCGNLSAEQTAFWKACMQASLNFEAMSESITDFCRSADKPVVLMIDEVDKSSDNQMFLNFIGMLRELYLRREDEGDNSTFQSVILAGVYDVKNLKLKLRPNEERKYNSPWNIAADFDVDMTFSPAEIATMLREYEADHAVGMPVEQISEEIYKYTSGYPYLVSKICELIDRHTPTDWSEQSVKMAVNNLLKDPENTLFGSLTMNIETYPDFERLITSVLMDNAKIPFDTNAPAIKLGSLFSTIKEGGDGFVMIHNIIFEKKLYNYFSSRFSLENTSRGIGAFAEYIVDGRLNMPYVIERFQHLMHEEYRTEDEKFLERHGRLLFLCFLKPIINGTGFYYVEPQTRENSRMDIVVTFGGEEFVIELKIWRGHKYEVEGKVQLAEYLQTRGLAEGYLVTFSFLKDKVIKEEPEWIEHNGKQIYEAVI